MLFVKFLLLNLKSDKNIISQRSFVIPNILRFWMDPDEFDMLSELQLIVAKDKFKDIVTDKCSVHEIKLDKQKSNRDLNKNGTLIMVVEWVALSHCL